MFKKTTSVVLLLVVKSSILIYSDTAGLLRVINFRRYGNIKFVGGSQNLVPSSNKFKCIMDCASKTNCQGFTYDTGACQQAKMYNVSSLQFTSNPDNVRIRRNILFQNLDSDPVSLLVKQVVTLETRLSIGDMIYLKAILLKHEDICIEIYDTLGKENITYHTRARCNDAICNNRVVVVDNKLNNNWNNNHVGRTYTLQMNEVFEIHVLITVNGIITYLNRVFQYTLNTKLSALTANYVLFYGNMNVLEFSL